MARPEAGSPRTRAPAAFPPARRRAWALALAGAVLAAAVLAGCYERPPPPPAYGLREDYIRDSSGAKPGSWPDLEGVTLTLLGNGAFGAFDKAAKQFESLTGVKVKQEDGKDGGNALKLLAQAKGSGKYDVIYGLDNMLLGAAVKQDLLEPYKPLLSDRIAPQHVFFPAGGPWHGTPVDHGYVGLNVDADHPGLEGNAVRSLADVRRFADQFVTQDPRVSTPGLGFLLSTVAAFPEAPSHSGGRYDWRDYWTDLFTGSDADRDLDGAPEGCVLVVPDWTTAYVQHFSAGYGAGTGAADKPIVTSYTESPAVENYYYTLDHPGETKPGLAEVILEANSTFHQVQVMAIAKGTKNQEAAQAWIEYTLTNSFQDMAAPDNGVYPVVKGRSVESTYQGIDPAPGSFRDAQLGYDYITANLDRWLKEWTALYEEHKDKCPAP